MFKPLTIEPTGRLQKLPPYLFAEIDKRKRELIAKGKDVIDLGVGDPDIPTADFIIEALSVAARNPRNHRYALDQGMPEFRHAIRDWFQHRFGVKLDSDKEILPLIGSKEGIGHLPLAVLDPGKVCLIPDEENDKATGEAPRIPRRGGHQTVFSELCSPTQVH